MWRTPSHRCAHWRVRSALGVILLLQLVANVLAATNRGWCGAHKPSPEVLQSVQAAIQHPKLVAGPVPAGIDVTVPVVWHVVYTNARSAAYKLAKQQPALLNVIVANMSTDFNVGAPAGFRYRFPILGPPLFHQAPAGLIFKDFCRLQGGLKQLYRRGDACILNVYLVDLSLCPPKTAAEGVLAYSSYPWELDKFFGHDGIVFNPLAFDPEASLSNTLSHEVGHWFGLLHTFGDSSVTGEADGCVERDGDFVADTPAEKEAHYDLDCANVIDSCPNLPGFDPWWNLMSYFTCAKQRFSKGQHNRMRNVYLQFRAPKCQARARAIRGIKFGPDCTKSNATSGTGPNPCCNTIQGLYCFQYKPAGQPKARYASCMSPAACRVSAGPGPQRAWQCTRSSACDVK